MSKNSLKDSSHNQKNQYDQDGLGLFCLYIMIKVLIKYRFFYLFCKWFINKNSLRRLSSSFFSFNDINISKLEYQTTAL